MPKATTIAGPAGLPPDLSTLLDDYLRAQPLRRLALVLHQQFVDSRLVSVVGDPDRLPAEADRVTLSRSLTVSGRGGTRLVNDVFIGRIEPTSAGGAKPRKPAKRATKKRAAAKKRVAAMSGRKPRRARHG